MLILCSILPGFIKLYDRVSTWSQMVFGATCWGLLEGSWVVLAKSLFKELAPDQGWYGSIEDNARLLETILHWLGLRSVDFHAPGADRQARAVSCERACTKAQGGWKMAISAIF